VKKKKHFYFFIFLLLILGLRVWFFQRSFPYQEGEIKLEGKLNREPQKEGEKQIFSFKGIRIKSRNLPELHYGDKIRLVGKLKKRVISKFYSQWYINYPEIEVINGDGGLFISRVIYSLRRKVNLVYQRVLPEPEAALLAGIVLGVKSFLPAEFYSDLKKTGLLHVVVASGANIIFVSQGILFLLSSFFSRRQVIFLTVPFIWLYAFLAGGEAPVLRAAIMATFSSAASFWGWKADSRRILFLTAFLMALVNPAVLFGLGFQLSFAATAGILFFKEKLDGFFKKKGEWQDSLTTTLSAQVFTTPLILSVFGSFSPFSLLANASLLGLISPLMLFGAILAFLGMVFMPLAYLWGLIVWVPLHLFVLGVRFFGAFMPVWQWHLPPWSLWLYFLGLFILIGRLRSNEEKK